ncbi:protein of unknown function [Nitrospira defluvii]|uniref:Uncharacterized protein n=1 Tax=Nitrospira defluvii TaxID=330214 RepID=D8P8Q3_9BACT|nr:protein of unknown function [Nitrospira defluvii]
MDKAERAFLTKAYAQAGGDAYWEKESPLKVTTDKLRICYYPTAGKLQISAGWKDRDTGKVRYGRTVVLDTASLTASPEALALFETILTTPPA